MNYINRILIVSGFTLLALLELGAQDRENTRYLIEEGVADSLYSEILDESREFFVQIPPGYRPGSGEKYPVAFLLDGELYLPTLIDVSTYYSGGFFPEMVLVGISNEKNRTRDLTPSHIETKYGMPFPQKNGDAGTFLGFIEKELIPYIEGNYPVTEYRTLIGHSYGALFTLFTFLERPDLFANYLAIDPSLDWDNQKILKESQGALTSQNYENKSLFMSLSGQLHMQNSKITIDNVMEDSSDFTLFARSNIAFSNLIRQCASPGLDFYWKFYPGDLHGTIVLPSMMDGLISIFEWFQMEHTDRINSFETSKDELLSIINHREKKLHEHFGYFVPPYPEELLNMSGYMNMDMQQDEKAKMYFELALEYYPQSANAYDSMADYYESKGEYGKALELVSKANEISPMSYYEERVETLKKRSSMQK